ncbi:M60 family metallopeptidase [Paenibacillus sp. MBLB4367]|uniref:M60 family metallopeptidase n=1 Tax=Paenibacillus sp. MBLB4367 TaxID=3384767 RepID=UPI0039082DF0
MERNPAYRAMQTYDEAAAETYSPILTSLDELRRDFAIWYQELASIPVFSASSGVCAIGDRAFPVTVPEAVPTIAASRYGKGRVAAAGSEHYFRLDGAYADGRSTLSRNILVWLTDREGQGEGTSNNRYEAALQGEASPIKLVTTSSSFAVDSALPIELVKLGSWTETELSPDVFHAAYVDASMRETDIGPLLHYVEAGGSIIVALNASGLESITRDTPLAERLRIGNYRGARLASDFALQRLLNRMGLTLLKKTVSPHIAEPNVLTCDKANDHHFVRMLEQGKAVEDGTLAVAGLQIGLPGADAAKKKQLLAELLACTLETLSPEAALYVRITRESEQAGRVSFPVFHNQHPYRNALLHFQFSRFTLKPDNGISPYADSFPGAVDAAAIRLNGVPVEIDFDFPDLKYTQMLPPKNWISTGLYAPPGGEVTVEVPEGTEHVTVQIGCHDDDLRRLGEWKRVPLVVHHAKLAPGTNHISSPYGGLVYLIPMNRKPGAKAVVTISGAVQAPYYVRGRTSGEQWKTMRDAAVLAPFAELQGERVILTVPSAYVRPLADPEALLQAWDEIAECYDELIGLAPDKAMPHKAHGLPYRFVADIQISGGYMHAGYPIMLPLSKAGELLDIDYIRHRAWGFWHELGHEFQQRPWTWGSVGEVTVNILSLYVQERFGNVSNLLTKDSDGMDVYDKALAYLDDMDPEKHFNQTDYFIKLVMFKQLQLAFGWGFYTKLYEAYRETPYERLPFAEQQKIDTFAETASRIAGVNLLAFFDKWKLSLSDEARHRIEGMHVAKQAADVWKLREPSL